MYSTPRGGYGRYIIESGLSIMIALGTLALSMPFVVACASRPGSRVIALITLVVALMPVPLGMFLLRVLASWREITLT